MPGVRFSPAISVRFTTAANTDPYGLASLPDLPLRMAAMDLLRLSRSSANRSAVLALLAAVAVGACAAPPPPGAAGDATLSGSVTYLPRIALPPDAVVHVRLEDVSGADTPAVTLAEETIPTERRQVPIPFELHYDPTRIEPSHRYSLRAEIRDGHGALLWTTDSHLPILGAGAPVSDIEIRVVQVDHAGGLVGPAWRLVRIETTGGGAITPEVDEPYSITFQNDGRYSGRSTATASTARTRWKPTTISRSSPVP
jgi:putative lipoprotein